MYDVNQTDFLRSLQNKNLVKVYLKGMLVSALLISPILSGVTVQEAKASTTSITQQKMKVQGNVTDPSGEPLVGVSVKVKNSGMGAITDMDGHFSLEVPPSAILQFSYVGFKNVEAKASRQEMHVTMSNSEDMLNEVVVVAYGTQRKVTVTGAVASVNSDEILKTPTANVESSLAGRIPGLTAIQSSGEPGRDDVTFYLRGVGTTNGKAPLVLVDGVPRDNMSSINSNEIATISVLKDASATAVFGVRGANGVILITTKRGQKGKINVTADVNYSLQEFAVRPKMLDSYTYAQLRNEALSNDGVAPEYTQEDLDAYQSWQTGNPTDPYAHPNNNWMDIIFKKTAPQTRANLNVTGGSDRTQYFMSAGYVHQGGLFHTESRKSLGYDPQSKMDRYNFRSNLDHEINKNLKASLDVSSYISKINGTAADGGVESVLPWTMSQRPTTPGPLTVSDYPLYYGGNFLPMDPGHIVVEQNYRTQPSPWGKLNRSGYKLETQSGLNAILTLDLKLDFITKGLSTKGMVSFESKAISITSAYKNYVAYDLETLPTGETVWSLANGTEIEDGTIGLGKSTASSYYINMQWYLNYARQFGKHDVSGMILAQRDYRHVNEWSGYSDPYLPFNVLGVSGRFTYNYDTRYLFEFNMGYNGSEQFSPNKRFGFFPAFSVGWVASDEEFIKKNLPWLTNLKLRASYGKVGNDKIGTRRFLYLDNVSVGGLNPNWMVNPTYGIGDAGNRKINFNYIGNPDVTWEIAWKQNYGFDITVFKDFSATFDIFNEKRSNVLISRQTIPSIQGISQGALPNVNMGKVDNKGFEFTLAYNKKFNKDIDLNVSLNYSYAKNEVKQFDELRLSDDYAYQYRTTGYSIGQKWGYKIDHSVDEATGRDGSGFFNSQEQIDKSGLEYEIGTPSPGDFIYQDLNHDGKINDKDMAPIGYSDVAPRKIYGANLNFRYKWFDVSVLFQGVSQFTREFTGWGIYENNGTCGFFTDHLTRWSEERYAQKVAGEDVAINHPRLTSGVSTSHTVNDYYLMNASYFRLKNAEIGFTFPSNWSSKIGATSIRVYANGNNLITWDHMNTDVYDPEQRILAYPVMRTFNFGLNIQF